MQILNGRSNNKTSGRHSKESTNGKSPAHRAVGFIRSVGKEHEKNGIKSK